MFFSKLKYILPVLVGLTLAGCAFDSGPDCPEPGSETDNLYLKLRFNVATGTRANPESGEEGNGSETGTDKENNIEDMTIFFYRSEDGLNAHDATKFLSVAYIVSGLNKEIDGSLTYMMPLGTYIPEDGDRIAIVANMGIMSLEEVPDLGTLRSMIVEHPWRAGAKPSEYSRFSMASAYNFDGVVHTKDLAGTYNEPFYVSAAIERTAARVDLWFHESNIASDRSGLVYDVVSVLKENVGKVHLSNILFANAMQQGTQTFKTVTEDLDDDTFSRLITCGDETVGTDKMPTNYVVEPHTALKKNATAADLANWYGETAADNVEQNYTTIFGSNNALSRLIPDIVTLTDAGYPTVNRNMTLGYINENTQPISLHHRNFITALVIKAVYEPDTVFADASGHTPVADYTPGTTFYRYSPTRGVMDEKDSKYFLQQEDALAYQAAHPEDLAVVTPYINGICYYTVRLRHANNDASDPHRECAMEYGIVRNNIYRVMLGFTGIGTPEPHVDQPMSVNFRIFVRKWNFRMQPEIIL